MKYPTSISRFLYKIQKTIFVFTSVFILSGLSCMNTASNTTEQESIDILWEDKGSKTVSFSCDDVQFVGASHVYNVATYNSNNYKIEVRKESGSTGSGFGMIFFHDWISEFYNICINTKGMFLVEKKSNDGNVIIKNWTASDKLYQGFDTTNTIEMLYKPDSTKFILYFNNYIAYEFFDTTHRSGKPGFYASIPNISQTELFGNPEKITFKLIK